MSWKVHKPPLQKLFHQRTFKRYPFLSFLLSEDIRKKLQCQMTLNVLQVTSMGQSCTWVTKWPNIRNWFNWNDPTHIFRMKDIWISSHCLLTKRLSNNHGLSSQKSSIPNWFLFVSNVLWYPKHLTLSLKTAATVLSQAFFRLCPLT